MLRTALAVVAAIGLVGMLVALIIESRSVDQAYYVFQAERTRAIETTKDDLTTIIASARSAFSEGRSVPQSVESALERITAANAVLQDNGDRPPSGELKDQLIVYDEAIQRFLLAGQAFAQRQNTVAGSLRALQEESPAAVKDLRRFDLRSQSQNSFTLAIDIIEFASGQSLASRDQLLLRINALGSDSSIDARAPGLIDEFVSAARTVVTEHGRAEAALQRLSSNAVANDLWTLSDIVNSENQRAVSRAERARLLLSVCTLILVGGVAYVAYRLQGSYRELNKSNSDLEVMNNSLEERVGERTVELSSAYDDLKESQVQLVQAEKMSSLGELVAGISHEINTPLWYLISNATIIQERLETFKDFAATGERMLAAMKSGEDVKQAIMLGLKDMRRMLSDGLGDDLAEAIDLTRDSVEGLEDLTELAQSLKDFSRLDRAQQGDFDVNEGLDKTLLIAKNKLKQKVSVHKHYGEVPVIHCSPSQINQVFLNLLTNAADAIEDSGEIVVRTWQEGDRVHVSIADSGCGIPDKLMSKIRDPFFTTKEVGKGTGLGLSIVEQIISSHDGEMIIDSEVGRGTNITVVLPIGVSADAVAESAEGEPPAANDDVLVASDVSATNNASQSELPAEGADNPEPDAVTA